MLITGYMMERNSMICPGCGAVVSLTDSVCRYCAAQLKSGRTLSREDMERLRVVVNAMEDSLKAAENNSRVAGLSFFLLAVLAITSYFIYSPVFPAGWRASVLTAVTGAVLFIVFGFVISITNRNAWVKLYNRDLKFRIEEYPGSMNFSRYEFDHAADETLPKNARLRAFLFKT